MKECRQCGLKDKDKLAVCDACVDVLCQGCSSLGTTELRCIQLTSRVSVYKCTKCLAEKREDKIADLISQAMEIQFNKLKLDILKEFEVKIKNLEDKVENGVVVLKQLISERQCDIQTPVDEEVVAEKGTTNDEELGRNDVGVLRDCLQEEESIYPQKKSTTIYFFADQQGQKIADDLEDYYNGYSVETIILPGATVSDILKAVRESKPHFMKNDHVVLQIGGNEVNPNRTVYEVITLIEELREFSTYVLPVIENRFLNERKLNELIQLNLKSVGKFRNLHLLPHSQTKLIATLVFAIDCVLYENKYILGNTLKALGATPQAPLQLNCKDRLGRNSPRETENKKGYRRSSLDECSKESRVIKNYRQLTVEECFRRQFFRARRRDT